MANNKDRENKMWIRKKKKKELKEKRGRGTS